MDARHATIDTPLGEITLVAYEGRLTGLYFRHHWYRPAEVTFGPRVPVEEDPLLQRAACQVQGYLMQERTHFDVPISLTGDGYQRRVWELVSRIPRGETTTYGQLAARLGDKTAAQRVGKTVGLNPLCIIVPCHRVIGANGQLTGYAGGLARKKVLLDLEEPALVKAGRLF
jgi:methylated-DNA-[protein]-cysteine S-methyltransferase